MVLNATFNNISILSWQSDLLLEETGVLGENHRPVACSWKTLSHNDASSVKVLLQWNAMIDICDKDGCTPLDIARKQNCPEIVEHLLKNNGSLLLWSYGSWICSYLWNQFLSPLLLWVRTPLRRDVLNTSLCDKVFQLHATGRWFSPSTPVSSNNKSHRHDKTEVTNKSCCNDLITLCCNATDIGRIP
jgi:hypothetical protein